MSKKPETWHGRNPERVDEQPEMLPSLPGELDHAIGQLFKEGRARAFGVLWDSAGVGEPVDSSGSGNSCTKVQARARAPK